MKLFPTLVLWTSLSSLFVAAAPAPEPNYDYDSNPHLHHYPKTSLQAISQNYKRYIQDTLNKRSYKDQCNSRTVTVRKEWGSMSRGDRKEYIEAVTCLIKKPALSKPADVPGARNRLDDFAAAHIQQSNNIHFNGNLYAWHRYFTWAYEKALREECGYKGSQPYWDWTLSADDPRKSPVFDGSPYSMGSNGKVTFHGATLLTAFGKQFTLPPGTGGGCVEKGPFSDLIVNLGVNPTIIAPVPAPVPAQGPDASAAQNSTSNSSAPVDAKLATSPTLINPALQYNPRCLTRDINLFWSNQTHASDVEFLLACPNVDCLEKRADGWELPADQPQPLIHAAGHFSVGGLQNDPFASPGDPIFYLHHAQFDRVWAMWQAQDSQNRVYQVGGTKTPFNTPPSENVTLDDFLGFGAVAGNVKLRDIMSTLDGPFCYYYDD